MGGSDNLGFRPLPAFSSSTHGRLPTPPPRASCPRPQEKGGFRYLWLLHGPIQYRIQIFGPRMGAAPSSAHTQDGISTCIVACRAPSFRVGKRGPCYMNKPGRQKAPMHGANSGRSPTLQQGRVNPGLDPTQWNEKNKL